MAPGLELVQSPAADSFYLLNSGHLILTDTMCDKEGQSDNCVVTGYVVGWAGYIFGIGHL